MYIHIFLPTPTPMNSSEMTIYAVECYKFSYLAEALIRKQFRAYAEEKINKYLPKNTAD